jgi:hypothetical protein
VDVLVVPSVQVVGVPLAAGAAGLAAGAGAAVAGVAEAAGAAAAAFCTPPWPEQVPLPVDVLVVPSLQVVGGLSARAGRLKASASSGAAMRPASVVIFISVHSLIDSAEG